MSIIRIVGGDAAQRAKLQDIVHACLADSPEQYTISVDDRARQERGAIPLSGSRAMLSLMIGLAGAETSNILHQSGGVMGPHARLLIYSDENSEAFLPLVKSTERGSDEVDSVHPWPEGIQDAVESFRRWLQLGIALAEARYATQWAQHILADAWIGDRKRWAEHIHGGPIQELVASIFMLGAVPQEIAQPIENQLLKTIGQLREFSQTMKPPAMRELGLAAAMRATLRYWQQSFANLNPTTDFDGEIPELDDSSRDVLFLIFQKLLTALLVSAPGNGASVRLVRLDTRGEKVVSKAADSSATADIRMMVVWGNDDSAERDSAERDSVGKETPDAAEHPGTAAVKHALPLIRQLAGAISAYIILTQTHAGGGALVVHAPLRRNM